MSFACLATLANFAKEFLPEQHGVMCVVRTALNQVT